MTNSGLHIKTLISPSVEPVTLDQVKTHSKIEIDVEDSYIEGVIIPAARDRAEVYLRRRLVEQTVRLTLDCFSRYSIKLPIGPVQSIAEIRYRDSENVVTVLDSSVYGVDLANEPVRIFPEFSEVWPATVAGRPAAVEVDFVVGYPAGGSPDDPTANIPPAIISAILLDCGHLLEHREAVSDINYVVPLPIGYEYALSLHRLDV